MKTVPCLVLVAAAVLVLTVPAQAKEIRSLELCGPTECATFGDRGALRGRLHTFLDLVATGVEPSGRYYRGEIRAVGDEGETHAMLFRYDPEHDLVLTEGVATGWGRMTNRPPAAVLERLAGIEPFGTKTAAAAAEREENSASAGAASGDPGFPLSDVIVVLSALALAALGLLAVARRRGAAAAGS